jgi:hypothetical protein
MAPTGPLVSFLETGYYVIQLLLFSISGYRLFPINNILACTLLEVITEVPSPCLAINEIPFTIRNELQ